MSNDTPALPTLSELHHSAITAAKKQDWPAAITHNLAILEQEENSVPAKMRLGVAYVHTDQEKAARKAFEEVMELEPTNLLAQKHLSTLKAGKTIEAVTAQASDFIEEPGKTKITELHRLAGKPVLQKLRPGDVCELKNKGRFISVEHKGVHVGSLADDLSSRLCKLMKAGNTYQCLVYSTSTTQCSVFLKEISRAPENASIPSFPVSLQNTQDEWLFLDDSELNLEDAPPPEYFDPEAEGAAEPQLEIRIQPEEEGGDHRAQEEPQSNDDEER